MRPREVDRRGFVSIIDATVQRREKFPICNLSSTSRVLADRVSVIRIIIYLKDFFICFSNDDVNIAGLRRIIYYFVRVNWPQIVVTVQEDIIDSRLIYVPLERTRRIKIKVSKGWSQGFGNN